MVRILVSSDDSALPSVTIQTESGTVIAKLANQQPINKKKI